MSSSPHQAEPDRDTADILDARAGTAAERDQSIINRTGATAAILNVQNLYDRRGADIGTQHDGERGHQADEPLGGKRSRYQRGGGTALEQRGRAEAGREGGETVVQRLGQQ